MDKHTQELRRNDQISKARIDRMEAFCAELFEEVRKIKMFVKYIPPENPPVQNAKNGNKSQLDEAMKNIDHIETGMQTQGGRRKIINN